MDFVQPNISNVSNWINPSVESLQLQSNTTFIIPSGTAEFPVIAIILLSIATLDTLGMAAAYIYYFYQLQIRFPITMICEPELLPDEPEDQSLTQNSHSVVEEEVKYSNPSPKQATAFDSSESVVADLRPFNPSVIGNFRPRSTILSPKQKYNK